MNHSCFTPCKAHPPTLITTDGWMWTRLIVGVDPTDLVLVPRRAPLKGLWGPTSAGGQWVAAAWNRSLQQSIRPNLPWWPLRLKWDNKVFHPIVWSGKNPEWALQSQSHTHTHMRLRKNCGDSARHKLARILAARQSGIRYQQIKTQLKRHFKGANVAIAWDSKLLF